MKSKANIKSHPLHPILVVFPIAFFIGTFIFDGLGWFNNNAGLQLTGRYLNIAGIIGAIAAAIPGLIDFFYTVPPKSSARKRAAQHGILNTTVLLIFSFVMWYRHSAGARMELMMGLEAIGLILLSIAGWLGGTLVFRNQIGVDIRYANAGKWKEEYLGDKQNPVKVADTSEIKPNGMKLIHLKGKRIVVAATADGYVAFEDRCPHRGGSLAGGTIACGVVQCPWHGSQFDISTGTLLAGPAKQPIKTYPITVSGSEVLITL